MSSMKIPRQRYYKVKSSTGATTLYTHERHVSSSDTEHRPRYRPNLNAKYYLRRDDSLHLENIQYFEFTKSVSFTAISQSSVLSN